jgi:hypothetical protein
MSLTRQDVEKIAHLARLSITDQEMPVYVTSLSSIVNFVDELSRVRTPRTRCPWRIRSTASINGCGRCGDGSDGTKNTRPTRPRCKRGCTSCRESSSRPVRAMVTMLHTLSIGELAERLNSRQLSSVELTRAFSGAHRTPEPALERR